MNEIVNRSRRPCGLVAGISLALASVQPLKAQTAADTLAVTQSICESAALAAAIGPSSIGEPVSGVVLESLSWAAKSENTPAHCMVNGRLEPVDRSSTA